MAGLLPESILVHAATPRTYVEAAGEWIEGEPSTAPEAVEGEPFPCVLFMPGPGGGQGSDYRMRTVREPTLLYNPGPRLGPETELLLTAPEFDLIDARYLVVGEPQPFGAPGTVGGYLATLRAVED